MHALTSVLDQAFRWLCEQPHTWTPHFAKLSIHDGERAYLRLLVDEISLEGNELIVRGSHRRLADAIGFMQKRKLGEVPSFVNDWRARQDSNL